MRDKLKVILKYSCTFIILILIYLILGAATSAIPQSFIEENSKKSAEYLLDGKECSDIKIKNTFYKKEYLFNYTNAIMLNTAYSIDTNKPLESFLLARKNYIPGTTEIFNQDTQYGLVSASNWDYQNQTGEYYYVTHKDYNIVIKESFEYARYWHGYLSLLRPALLIFSYQVIEILSSITFAVLVIGCTYLMCQKISKVAGILFLLSFVVMNSFYTARSINEVTCFVIMLCSNLYILCRYKKIKHMPLVFLVIGSITNYLDLLTLPLLTFAMPVTIYFLLKEKEEMAVKKSLVEYIKLGIAWGIGYGLTWFAKWILVDVICNRNIIEIAFKQILYRTSGKEGDMVFSYADVLGKNIEFLGNQPIYMTGCVALALIITGMIKDKKQFPKNKIKVEQLVIYIVTMVLPFAWYFALKNHSAIHARFTHRLLLISIFTFWMLLVKIWGVDRQKINKK